MKNITKIVELNFNNGNIRYERSIMTETGLPADTLVEWVGRRSRWTGTGYVDSLYRIVGTDDLLIIHHNDGPLEDIHRDTAEVKKGFFDEARIYSKRVGKLSRKYGIPFNVALALGDCEELYYWFVAATPKQKLRRVTNKTLANLHAGISRRKEGLFEVLGAELYDALKIGGMGQENSTRIACYVAELCEQATR